jgi:hypothetical protein
MDATCSSETSDYFRRTLNSHRCDNLKSYIIIIITTTTVIIIGKELFLSHGLP